MNNYFRKMMKDSFKFSDTTCFILQKVCEATEELTNFRHDRLYPIEYFDCEGDACVWEMKNETDNNDIIIKIRISRSSSKPLDAVLLEFDFRIMHDCVGFSFMNVQGNGSKIIKYRKQLSSIATVANRRHISMTDDDIDNTIHNFHLKMSYQQAGEFVKEKITFDEFLKLGKDDINNNKTVYRFTNNLLIVPIENHLRHKLGLECEHFDFGTTMINQIFYIEDYGVHSITETDGDTFLDLIDKGYVVVDIDMKEGE